MAKASKAVEPNYYAGNGVVSTDEIEGGIQITAEEYQAALAGMMAAKIVSIEGGAIMIQDPPPPEHPTTETDSNA